MWIGHAVSMARTFMPSVVSNSRVFVYVEDVVMQTTVFEVPERTLSKRFRTPSPGISAQVVSGEDFIQVGQIVFRSTPLVVE